MSKKDAFVKGLRDGLPICLGYLSVSFTFGLRTTSYGMPWWMGVLISMTNLTSAGQFAGTDLIAAGATYLEIAVTTFVINLRYMLMSLSLSQRIEPGMTGPRRAAAAFGITDEIFAVSMQQKGPLGFPYLAGLIFFPYWGWALGTLIGATATGLLPPALRSALGIAIYGMFLAILVPPVFKVRPVAVTVGISIALSCLFRYTPGLRNLSGGWVIILCTVIASTVAALRYPVASKEEPEGGGG